MNNIIVFNTTHDTQHTSTRTHVYVYAMSMYKYNNNNAVKLRTTAQPPHPPPPASRVPGLRTRVLRVTYTYARRGDAPRIYTHLHSPDGPHDCHTAYACF